MMMQKRILLLLILGFAASLLLTMTIDVGAADDEDAVQPEAVAQQLDVMESRLDAIVETGFVWRWTYDRIAQAREALAAGDVEVAAALLSRAAHETELAYEQAEKAETNWAIAVPK